MSCRQLEEQLDPGGSQLRSEVWREKEGARFGFVRAFGAAFSLVLKALVGLSFSKRSSSGGLSHSFPRVLCSPHPGPSLRRQANTRAHRPSVDHGRCPTGRPGRGGMACDNCNDRDRKTDPNSEASPPITGSRSAAKVTPAAAVLGIMQGRRIKRSKGNIVRR